MTVRVTFRAGVGTCTQDKHPRRPDPGRQCTDRKLLTEVIPTSSLPLSCEPALHELVRQSDEFARGYFQSVKRCRATQVACVPPVSFVPTFLNSSFFLLTFLAFFLLTFYFILSHETRARYIFLRRNPRLRRGSPNNAG